MAPGIAHSEREHAICGASGSEIWLKCHGAAAMQAKLPPEKASDAAEEGTQAHELIDKLISPLVFHWNTTGQDAWATSAMMDFTIHDSYPREMWDCVTAYCRLLWDMVLHYKPKKVFHETRVELSKPLGMFGTSDTFFAFRDNSKAILSVWDYKNGRKKIVEPTDPQLPYYAAAISLMFPKIRFDEYWLNIYQPRAPHEDGAHRQAILSHEQMEHWIAEFLRAGQIAMEMHRGERDIETVAGEHCLWCKAKTFCNSYSERMTEEAGMDFTGDPDVLVPELVEDQRKEIHTLDMERVSRQLRIASEVQSYFSNLRKISINYILNGGEIPGWKVVEGKRKRKWRSETGNVARGLQSIGIENPYSDKLRGLGSIEEELKKQGVRAKDVKAKIAHLVDMSSPALTLVDDSDPREPVSMAAIASGDFTVIGEKSDDEEID